MKNEENEYAFTLLRAKIDAFIQNKQYDLALSTLFEEILNQPNNLRFANLMLEMLSFEVAESFWTPKYNEQDKRYVGGFWLLFDFVALHKNNLDKKVMSVLKHTEAELRLCIQDPQVAWDVAAEGIIAWSENQDLLTFLDELAEVGFCDDSFHLDTMEELVEEGEFSKKTFKRIQKIVEIGEGNI